MSNDVTNADMGLPVEPQERAAFIDAYAPPSAPMAMPLQTLEVGWSARLRLAVVRPSLVGAAG
ncbi:hypothetical protein [Amorphus sp. MBR-141]